MSARRMALARAAAAFALVGPIAYVGQRLFEVARAPIDLDPVLVLRDAHTAFYWRAATATWWAALVATLVYASARRGALGSRYERALIAGAIPLIVLLGLLAYRFP